MHVFEMGAKEVDLHLIVKCPVDKTEKFFHHLIDGICGQREPLYCDFSQIWSLTEWWEVNETWKRFFCEAVKLGNDKEKVSNELSQLPQLYKELIMNCLNIHQQDIRQSLLDKTNNISESYLQDFDWKLKLILSSDKLSNIREPCLELDLDVQTGSDKKQLCVEMSKQELKSFIDSLEAAHKVVVQMMT